MPILNYTTTIAAAKTVSEIQTNLSKHGATAILIEYDNSDPVALSFKIKTPQGELPFRLPVNYKAVLTVLQKQNVSYRYKTQEQAVKIAWRIVKDWTAAQCAILETSMVTIEQVFLPYLVLDEGKTLYEKMADRGFKQLGMGTKDEQKG